MPAMHYRLRWPDASESTCYSPSLVIKDYFSVGESYPLADFVARSRAALNIANERVRAKYGFACSQAITQLARIESAAMAFGDAADARVTVDAFEE
jgi:uncharacterized repeat protein (TIGR04042 family)